MYVIYSRKFYLVREAMTPAAPPPQFRHCRRVSRRAESCAAGHDRRRRRRAARPATCRNCTSQRHRPWEPRAEKGRCRTVAEIGSVRRCYPFPERLIQERKTRAATAQCSLVRSAGAQSQESLNLIVSTSCVEDKNPCNGYLA
jgi:hypothetical protein